MSDIKEYFIANCRDCGNPYKNTAGIAGISVCLQCLLKYCNIEWKIRYWYDLSILCYPDFDMSLDEFKKRAIIEIL